MEYWTGSITNLTPESVSHASNAVAVLLTQGPGLLALLAIVRTVPYPFHRLLIRHLGRRPIWVVPVGNRGQCELPHRQDSMQCRLNGHVQVHAGERNKRLDSAQDGL